MFNRKTIEINASDLFSGKVPIEILDAIKEQIPPNMFEKLKDGIKENLSCGAIKKIQHFLNGIDPDFGVDQLLVNTIAQFIHKAQPALLHALNQAPNDCYKGKDGAKIVIDELRKVANYIEEEMKDCE